MMCRDYFRFELEYPKYYEAVKVCTVHKILQHVQNFVIVITGSFVIDIKTENFLLKLLLLFIDSSLYRNNDFI